MYERGRYLLLTVLAVALLWPGAAHADGEATFVIGALLGDDLELGSAALTSSFDNSPLYGGRVGWYGWPLGLEGSLVASPSGVPLLSAVGAPELDVRVVYAEANLVLVLVPGPLSPFVSGGVGLHSFKFERGAIDFEHNKLGYNFGGGLKAGVGPLGLRVDVRDHVTSFEIADFPFELLEVLPLAGEPTLHNFEVSAGVSIRF